MALQRTKVFETMECYISGENPLFKDAYVTIRRVGIEMSITGSDWVEGTSRWMQDAKNIKRENDGTFTNTRGERLIPETHEDHPLHRKS